MSEENQNPSDFIIEKIYTKDLSFEAPNAPAIFQEDWQPDLQLDLNMSSNAIAKDTYEVVLKVTVTVKSGEKNAFLVETDQAGIFTITGFPEEQMGPLLGSVCPNILFPYAREVISDVVTRGGFPQLVLAPINFDALYAQQMEERDAATTH